MANAAACRAMTGNINCAPWVFKTSATCPIWNVHSTPITWKTRKRSDNYNEVNC